MILEAGPRTDAAFWNRHLLAPLGVGRLTERRNGAETPVRATSALNAARAQRWGNPGAVSTHFGFRAERGTVTLLETTAAARATDSAVAAPVSPVQRRLGRSEVGSGRRSEWTGMALQKQ